MIRCFSRLVKNCFSREHIDQGFVEAKGRDGKEGRFPLTTISLGIVDCSGDGLNLQELARRAAEVKKYAKSIPGSVYVRDRRKSHGRGKRGLLPRSDLFPEQGQ